MLLKSIFPYEVRDINISEVMPITAIKKIGIKFFIISRDNKSTRITSKRIIKLDFEVKSISSVLYISWLLFRESKISTYLIENKLPWFKILLVNHNMEVFPQAQIQALTPGYPKGQWQSCSLS